MWKDSPISTYKKQERLKGFFHFCVARDWIRTNPVAAIKPVKVPPSPTLPFDEKQMATILEACDRYPIKGIYNHGNRQRMNRDVIEFLRDENRVLKAQLHGAKPS
jgi:site-specific recombinase XerD